MGNIRKFVIEALADNEISEMYESWVNEASREGALKTKPTDEQISKAITDRYYVGIYYKGSDDPSGEEVLKGFRLIEPYVLGQGYKMNGRVYHNNRKYLRAFVIKDTLKDKEIKWTVSRRKSVSKTQKVPYWRMFRVDRIEQFMVFPKKITKFREKYNEKDKCMGRIITSIPKTAFKGQSSIK